MDNYVSRLILAYLFNIGSEYEVGELMQLSGKNSKELTVIINYLLDNEYIAYCEYELTVTQKGISYLISNDSLNDVFLNDCPVLRNIDPQSALSINEPYVPKKFNRKYKKNT